MDSTTLVSILNGWLSREEMIGSLIKDCLDLVKKLSRGDRGFCSVECRCRQIGMDEEGQAAATKAPSSKRDQCSLAAMKPQRPTPSPAAAAAPPPPPKARRGATGNRPNAFAY
nr:Zf-FLZ domain containing protein [Ipomoea batatas]